MVVDINGPPCQSNCPNYGCLETLCSGTALVRRASVAVARRPDTRLGHALEEGRELTGPLITELGQEGDPVALDVIREIGHNLGVGIVSLVNIFNPQAVVIGGGVSAAGDLLLEPARAIVRQRALLPGRDAVRIEVARYGAEAGLLGAALMARDGSGLLSAGYPAREALA
jgi:glucokinase